MTLTHPGSAPSLPATLGSLQLLRCALASGPLPRMLFSQISSWLPPSLPGGLEEKAELLAAVFLKTSASHQHFVSSCLRLFFLFSTYHSLTHYLLIYHVYCLSPQLKYTLHEGREFCHFALYYISSAPGT